MKGAAEQEGTGKHREMRQEGRAENSGKRRGWCAFRVSQLVLMSCFSIIQYCTVSTIHRLHWYSRRSRNAFLTKPMFRSSILNLFSRNNTSNSRRIIYLNHERRPPTRFISPVEPIHHSNHNIDSTAALKSRIMNTGFQGLLSYSRSAFVLCILDFKLSARETDQVKSINESRQSTVDGRPWVQV